MQQDSFILGLGLTYPYIALIAIYLYLVLYRIFWLSKYLYPYMITSRIRGALGWAALTLIVGPLPFYVFINPKIDGAMPLDYYASYPFGAHALKRKAQLIWFISMVGFVLASYLWYVFIAP